MANENLYSENDRPRKRRRSRSKRSRRKSGAPDTSTPTASALLADPATIAGAPSEEDSSEAVAGGAQSHSDQSQAAPLDATAARQLAVDARARERASRAALEEIQREQAQDPSAIASRSDNPGPQFAPTHPSPETRATQATGAEGTRWQKRALVRTGQEASSPSDSLPASEPRTAPASAALISEPAYAATRALAAAQAEVRELQSTLSIARGSIREYKQALAESQENRAALHTDVQQDVSAAENLRLAAATESQAALEAARAEKEELRAQLTQQTQTFEEQETERIALDRALEQRDALLAVRDTQLAALQDRFEAQDRALTASREEYELERRRHSRSLDVLAELRSTLLGSEVSGRIGDSPNTVPGQAREVAVPLEVVAEPVAPSSQEIPSAQLPPPSPPAEASPLPRPQAADPLTQAETRGPIFDAWQDDQIRRQFGPLGIDSLVDLLHTPLARRPIEGNQEHTIVLMGRGAWPTGERLAAGLIENGSPPFRIHISETDPRIIPGAPLESPVRSYLETLAPPKDPSALALTLESLAPDAILTRDFLSRAARPNVWLDALAGPTQSGACLLLSERTGIEVPDAPPEMIEIGERIWDLMPARYTEIPNSSERVETWNDGFSRCVQPAGNQLLSALRNAFPLEVVAQFGFLAEPFIGSPIALNFDPKAERDRRFLQQVAELDDRKIEAGLAPALHFVALVDTLAEED